MDNKPESIWGWIFLIAAVAGIVSLGFTIYDHQGSHSIATPSVESPIVEVTESPSIFTKEVVTEAPVTPPPTPYSPETIKTNISRSDRDWQHYFCGSKLNYNVFKTGEVKNCYAFHMNYSSEVLNPECGKTASGTRIVYVRDKANEEINNDSAWIEVGRFSYDSTSGETISVDIDWEDDLGLLDVYSMAVVMDKNMSGASFSANWGNFITLYSYDS